jgi:catecholate siderophore receptor
MLIFRLTDQFGRRYARPMSDYLGRVLLTLVVAGFPSIVRAQDVPVRFDIPAGSLSEALTAFEAAAGLHVTLVDQIDSAALQSPGVSGTHTPAEALRRLTAGTGLTVKMTTRGPELHIAAGTIRLSVDERASTYRPIDSASATKTVTPLRDIPQTVSVVPAELLRDQHAQSVGDAMRNVVGVSVSQGEGNRDQLLLRGNSTNSDFFMNGIRDDQERLRDLYNVDAIEVIQGPAAVLFGRGGAGGIVNLVTNRPVRGMRPDAALEVGAYGHKRGTAQVGVPIGASGALRVAAMGEDSGGFRDTFFLHRYAVNPTALFTPDAKSSLIVGYEHLTDERRADRGIPSQNGAPVAVPVTQFFGSDTQNESHNDLDSVRAAYERKLTPSLTLRSTALAARYGKFYQNVYPGSAVSAAGTFTLAAYNHGIDRVNVFSQTDLVYDAHLFGVRHTLLGGMELGHQAQDELRHQAANLTGVPVSDSIRDANFAAAPLTVDRAATGAIAAGYVQDQLDFGHGVKAVAGARIDRFSVSVDDHMPGAADLSRVDVEVSPRAGVIYQPSASVSLYTSYSYTFLPSGQTLGLARNTAEVAPENARNYEAGTKIDLASGRLTWSAAVFRLDRNNVKNTDPTDPSRLVLTGQQRTDGVQTSVAGSLSKRWRITGGYANLRAAIVKDTASAPAGRRVGLVPRHQGTLWTTYDLTSRLGVGGGLVSQAGVFTSFTNQVRLPAYTRLDGVAYYNIGRYRVALNLENVLNRGYYSTANNDNNISPGLPRSAQLTLRVAF